jgi:hypothetical protein
VQDADAPRPSTVQHVADEILADYAARRLPEWDELAVEEHLAACDDCSTIVRSSLLVGDVWDAWTAMAHGEAAAGARLLQAVREAQTLVGDASWQARLMAWSEHWSGRAEAAVRVVMDAHAGASRVLTEGLEALSRPGSAWQFAPLAVPAPTRGPRAGETERSPTVALAAGVHTQARVAVGGERREIVVRLDGHLDPGRAPLVLLIPDSGDPRLALPEQPAGAPYWIARFADVPPGEYIVAFEPISPAL